MHPRRFPLIGLVKTDVFAPQQITQTECQELREAFSQIDGVIDGIFLRTARALVQTPSVRICSLKVECCSIEAPRILSEVDCSSVLGTECGVRGDAILELVFRMIVSEAVRFLSPPLGLYLCAKSCVGLTNLTVSVSSLTARM